MRLFRSAAAGTALIAVSVTTAFAQPTSTTTEGYLKYVGTTSGAPSAAGLRTGPYVAQFGPTAGTVAPDLFNVFCIDWLSRASSTEVKILTFSQATAGSPTGLVDDLQEKFSDHPGLGLTQQKLASAAWLTTQMTNANKSAWNEMHVALWRLFWKKDAGTPDLPDLNFVGSPGEQNAQYWYNLALAEDDFNASNFRMFVPYDVEQSCQWKNGQRVCTTRHAFDNDKQIFIGQVIPGQPNIVTPEPSSYALMGAGLLALGLVARRKRNA